MTGLLSYLLSKKFTKKHVAEKIAELPTGFHIKEAVASYSDLPQTGNTAGDVREVLDTGAFYFWDGDEFRPFHLAISIDDLLDAHSENAVQNKVIKAALDAKQDKDDSAELGHIAIFTDNGNTVSSGANIVDSTFVGDPTDDFSIPTTKYVGDTLNSALEDKQDKYVIIDSNQTTFVDSVEVPVLDKLEVTTAYNAFIAGRIVVVHDSLHDNYYTVHRAVHEIHDATTELTISINVNNAAFVDYVYDDTTDEVTAGVTYYTVSASDKEYWDAKQDKNTITRTTSTNVILTNNDTTVITQQVQTASISFELPEDDSEDFISSLIVKPYQNFIFSYEEPEGYSLSWGADGAPDFESGSIYELSFKLIAIQDPSGNEIIVGRWSKI